METLIIERTHELFINPDKLVGSTLKQILEREIKKADRKTNHFGGDSDLKSRPHLFGYN